MSDTESKSSSMIEVPTHMVGQVMQLMEDMVVTKEKRPTLQDTDEISEVQKVLDAKNTSNGWEFKLFFKDKSISWVRDEDCMCEQKITDYLTNSNRSINTAYLFCRVSTKLQSGKTSTSLESQEAELREAVGKGYQRVKVYNIRGSAYKSIPSEMRIVGEVAREGDAIWVWRVDRLSRNIEKYMSWLSYLTRKGVMIYAKSENLCYATNRIPFIQSILDAQKEAAAIGSRVKLALQRKRARGDTHIGGLPYGKKYKRILSDDGNSTVQLIVEDNPAEIAIINEIKATARTERPILVAERLNKEGKYKKGRPWNAAMVRRCQNNTHESSTTWRERVETAIIALGERNGSSMHALKSYLNLQPTHFDYLKDALKSGVESGFFIKNKGKYKLS